MPGDPADLIRRHAGLVLQWKDIHGRQSIWDVVKRDVSRLDPVALVGCAAHWNAFVHHNDGSLDDERQKAVVQFLASPDQLETISAAVLKKARRKGWREAYLPPVINRQQLLILMRLAFELGRWDGSGAKVHGSDLLDVLLRINDHLEALPDSPWYRPTGKRGSVFRRVIAFPLMFSLLDFSHRRRVENGITRTLRMLREIHPDLAARRDSEGSALDLPRLLLRGTNLPLETFLSLTFAASALTLHPEDAGAFRAGQVVGPEDKGDFNIVARNLIGESAATESDVTAFLARVAQTPPKFKMLLADPAQAPEQTNFTVFRKYPVVRFESGVIRVLDRQMLLDKLGDGAYWIMREVVECEATSGDERVKAVKRLNGWWGKLFEEYAHRLVEESSPASYVREPTFEGERGAGAVDGLLAYAPDVVLLEYKVSPLTPAARTSPKPRVLAREILSKFAGARGGRGRGRVGARGAPQLAAAIRGLLSGRSLGPVALKDVRWIFPVLVCAEHAMGAPMVNCLLNRRLRGDLADIDASRVRPLTVLTIEDFESMLGDGRDISLLLQGWLDSDPDLTTYPGLVLREKVLHGDGVNQWVRQAAEAWTREMLIRLFPHGTTARRGGDMPEKR